MPKSFDVVNLNEIHIDGVLAGNVVAAFSAVQGEDADALVVAVNAWAANLYSNARNDIQTQLDASEAARAVEEARYNERLAARAAAYDELKLSTDLQIAELTGQVTTLSKAASGLRTAIHAATGDVPNFDALKVELLQSLRTSCIAACNQVIDTAIQRSNQ